MRLKAFLMSNRHIFDVNFGNLDAPHGSGNGCPLIYWANLWFSDDERARAELIFGENVEVAREADALVNQ